MDPIEALRRAGGAARWGDLMSAGVGRRALSAAVKQGTVVSRIYGTYSLPTAGRDVWLAAAFRAQLTCVSLCHLLGLPLPHPPSKVHLVVPGNRAMRADDRRPLEAVVIHRSEQSWVEGTTSPVAVAIDLASQCADRFAQLALVDAALRAGKLYPGDIRDFQQTPPIQCKWLIDCCDREAQSIMESLARVSLMDAGFSVRPQVKVAGEGHRDLLVEGSVVVELDGWETHGKKPQFALDRKLDRATIRDGKVTLRYTYEDLFGRERADLVADVEAALRLLRKSA